MQFFLHLFVFEDSILQFDDRPADHMTKNQSLTNMEKDFIYVV
jgi:hypothetical protein